MAVAASLLYVAATTPFDLPYVVSSKSLRAGKVFFVEGRIARTRNRLAAWFCKYDGLTPEQPFPTLQDGLGACESVAGDVVILLPGVHTVKSPIIMNKDNVMLTSEGAHGATIQCDMSEPLIEIDADNVTLKNLTLEM